MSMAGFRAKIKILVRAWLQNKLKRKKNTVQRAFTSTEPAIGQGLKQKCRMLGKHPAFQKKYILRVFPIPR
jgi:hypothetical protein